MSLHEWPLYPGTGRLDEVGVDGGVGATCNVPLPAGATGDLYLRAVDELVAPLAARHAPDWVLVSCGFDAHRADPLAGCELETESFAVLARRVRAMARDAGAPLGLVLEGGYHVPSLVESLLATMEAVAE